ncbi:MAG: ribulose-phosphate 3-epimerase [Lachnospiraceae bacterium]
MSELDYKLSPSILAADFLKLGEEIRFIDEAGVPYIHIDVMDGIFVPSISFGIPILQAIRTITARVLDVHLMITHPEAQIEAFAKAGADIITFHVEAEGTPIHETLLRIKELGIKAGLSISPDTPVEAILPYLDEVDMILIMTVYPGRGGQDYLECCGSKVTQLRNILTQQHRQIDIEVDGGIKKSNVSHIMAAGANVIVAGSAIFEPGRTTENAQYFLEALYQNRKETVR